MRDKGRLQSWQLTQPCPARLGTITVVHVKSEALELYPFAIAIAIVCLLILFGIIAAASSALYLLAKVETTLAECS